MEHPRCEHAQGGADGCCAICPDKSTNTIMGTPARNQYDEATDLADRICAAIARTSRIVKQEVPTVTKNNMHMFRKGGFLEAGFGPVAGIPSALVGVGSGFAPPPPRRARPDRYRRHHTHTQGMIGSVPTSAWREGRGRG